MGFGLSSWRIILYILLLLVCVQASRARKIANKRWRDQEDHRHTYDQQQHTMHDHQWIYAEHDHDINDDGHKQAMDDHQRILENHGNDHPSSHMDHMMDPSLNIFFTLNDLKVGKIMPIYFSNNNPSSSPHLLSREETNTIPFTLIQLPNLLEFFSFSNDSPQAKAMEYTLEQCELEPIKGETRVCATSLESMLDFTRGVFGLDTDFRVLTTTHLTKPTLLQNYTILEVPKEISAPKMVACHTMPYPYAVFYCHVQESENRLFEIALGGENGERVQAAAVCHMDTSQWDRDHVSFRVLKIEPGTSHVCHFFPADNLVWVPLSGLV